ncbi:DUF6794 domain-containing protein [Rhodopirellula bahusiensis]|uniref:DUF6794 domain-containing protein n=1 Tax=Rhodopirellula bahusiensis TaxID=2014065 RepID=A0A2G1W817_9BACT|nr:DUF6794 domain-containing protein [Rhodopirellula bahusiensis]PHQ35185.1 hypothetical protein CEE69_12300 [Rhodopirellula bahusiensis]
MIFNDKQIPATIHEAAELLAAGMTDRERKQLLAGDQTDFHFGIGSEIRDRWIHADGSRILQDLQRTYTGIHEDQVSELIINEAKAIVAGSTD